MNVGRRAIGSVWRSGNWAASWLIPAAWFGAPRSRVAVCLHIFHFDAAHQIIDRLEGISSRYSLFVTYPESLPHEVTSRLDKLNRDVSYIPVSNIGHDVYPFLVALRQAQARDFDYICKIHTKRGDTDVALTWREEMLAAVLGGDGQFKAMIKTLDRQRSVWLVGPEPIYKSAKTFMYANESEVARLARLMEIPIDDDWGFFAGTMFWARRLLFEPLLEIPSEALPFAKASSAGDGDLAHAMERMFGLLPRKVGGKVMVVRRSGEIVPAARPSREAVTKTMRLLSQNRVVRRP